MKKLIVFYSRADENYFGGSYRYVIVGNTEKAANIIAELTGADLFKIEQKVPYAADYRTCVSQAVKDMREKVRPELLALPENFEEYQEIYLGYPNYCGTMPMAVYTFLESFNWIGKTIYPFCTHEGSGFGNSQRDIADTARGAKVEDGLAIHGSAVDSARELIKEWLSSDK